MKNHEPNCSAEINKMQQLADELIELQSQKNKGRGVSCVRTVADYLQMGNMQKAKAVCHTEHDKIDSYQDIKQFIIDNLFSQDEKHPWSVMERWLKTNEEE